MNLSKLKRKGILKYLIMFSYGGTKRYDKTVYETDNRDVAMSFFRYNLEKYESGALRRDFDCTFAGLVIQLNLYYQSRISIFDFNRSKPLEVQLTEAEERLLKPYERFRYIFQWEKDSFGILKETLYETDDRDDAVRIFSELVRRKYRGELPKDGPKNIVLKVSISPMSDDFRCLYLANVDDERDVSRRLECIENSVILHFQNV